MKKVSTIILLSVVILVLSISACVIYSHKYSVISIDTDKQYQKIDGWAFMPRMWEEDKLNNRFDPSFENYADAVSDYLVDEVGINAVRIEIQSGMENPENRWSEFYSGNLPLREYENYRFEKVNDNDDPYEANLSGFQFEQFDWRIEKMVLPLKYHLEEKGESLFINVNYTDFKWSSRIQQGTLDHAGNPEEYAEFVLVFFQRLRDKYGLIPDSFELILEPDNTAGWSGEKIAHGLLAARKRLASHGFHPEFIATSAASTKNSIKYFSDFLRVPGAVAQLGTLSYHRYGHSTNDIIELKELADKFHLKTAMLEKVNAGIDALLEDLVVGGVSSWQQWASAGKYENGQGDEGAYYVLVNPKKSPAAPEIKMAKQTRQLSSVFRFVRRGAIRVASHSTAIDQKTVAFVNNDGTMVVVVRDSFIGGPLKIRGLPAGRYDVRFVSDAPGPIMQLPSVTVSENGMLDLALPESGVATIYSAGVTVPGKLSRN